jgi:deoxyadenosine/deoxycytidine kinase
MLKRIEITGIIASGKTTLASVLADGGDACPVLESFSTNPFYDAFYRDPSGCAFETELTFLLQHYHDARRSCAGADRPLVCDFSFELDAAYAATTLNETERQPFAVVHQHVTKVMRSPDVLIALRCSAQESLRRIHRRGRPAEQSISAEYLQQLADAIDARLDLTEATVIEIDSEAIDFSVPGEGRDHLLHQVLTELRLTSLTT